MSCCRPCSGLLFGVALGVYLSARGVPPIDLMTRASEYGHKPLVILAESGLGSFGSLTGGFITGWISGSQRVICGVIMGVLSCTFGLLFMSALPLWANVLGLVLTMVMATSGAWLAEAIFGGSRRAPLPR